MHDCFISFSNKDKKITLAVLQALEQQGIKCWVSFRDALPGQDYALSIVRAIKSANFFILILSGNSTKSYHVINEINSAINARKIVIPFKIDHAPITEGMEYYIGKTHWIDAAIPPLSKHIETLVKSIHRQTVPEKHLSVSQNTILKLPNISNKDTPNKASATSISNIINVFKKKDTIKNKQQKEKTRKTIVRKTPQNTKESPIKKTTAQPANTSPKQNTLNSQNHETKASEKQLCKMVKYQDLLSLGYTSKTVSLQLVENDYINCNGIGLENEGTAMQWESFLQDNSDTFQYLINQKNEIVGNWSIVALDEPAFERAVKGELLEVEISLENTEMICLPSFYNGYILVFSLLPEYRVTENYNLVIRSFFKQIENYARNGIYFKRWCMNVFGKEVEALVKQLGFTYVIDNKVFGKIYYCDFMPLPNLPILKNYPELVEYYKQIEYSPK